MLSISFIISTIGKSPFLADLIYKLRQFDKNTQIILIDNSSNGCLRQEYFLKDKNLDYFYLKNAGVSQSRNFGASKSLNDLIYFLDDDVVPQPGWDNAFKKILSSNKMSIVGGPVTVQSEVLKLIPSKYTFLVGEKHLGNIDKKLSSNYLAGCNLIFPVKIFKKIGGFPTAYGHKNNKVILNEDIYIQEKARQIGYDIYYNNQLIVRHYWRGSYKDVIKRVKLQGIYDRRVDYELNKKRFILRLMKYSLLIPFYKLVLCLLKNKKGKCYFDLLKYHSYVFN